MFVDLSMERWVWIGRYLEKFVFLSWAFCKQKKDGNTINKNFNDPILYKLNAVKTFCIKILKVNVVYLLRC